jgi:hypothetical protein
MDFKTRNFNTHDAIGSTTSTHNNMIVITSNDSPGRTNEASHVLSSKTVSKVVSPNANNRVHFIENSLNKDSEVNIRDK